MPGIVNDEGKRHCFSCVEKKTQIRLTGIFFLAISYLIYGLNRNNMEPGDEQPCKSK